MTEITVRAERPGLSGEPPKAPLAMPKQVLTHEAGLAARLLSALLRPVLGRVG